MFESLRTRCARMTAEKQENLFLILSLPLFYLLVCVPILAAGFYTDDATIGSLIRGILLVTHQSLWTHAVEVSTGWTTFNGRIQPLLFMANLFFHYIFVSDISYQIARMFLIFGSFLPFAWLLKLLTGKREPAFALLFLIPCFWTIHYFFESLTSFATLMPQVTLFAGLTMCCWVKAEDTGRRTWHVWGAIAYVISLLTYETGLVACAAIVAMAWVRHRSVRAILRSTWPYLVVTAAFLAANVIARKYSVRIYEGIEVGQTAKILPTFAKQLSGTLPLSNLLFGHMHFHLRSWIALKNLLVYDIVSSLVLGPLAFVWFSRLLPKLKFTKKVMMEFAGIGVSFIIVPAALMSLSAKYQGVPPYEGYALHWGVSYLPVYMQYIGIAMLGLIALSVVYNRAVPSKKPLVIGVLSILLSLGLCLSVALNHQVVVLENDEWKNPRDLAEDALHHGLIPEMPSQNKFTIYSKRALWNHQEFYAQTINLVPDMLDTTTDPELVLPRNGKPSGIVNFTDPSNYMLDHEAFGDSSAGYAVLGQIKAMRYATVEGKRKVTGFTLKSTRVFIVENPEVDFLDILGSLQNKLSVERDRVSLLTLLAGKPISHGKGWILVEFPSDQEQDWLQ